MPRVFKLRVLCRTILKRTTIEASSTNPLVDVAGQQLVSTAASSGLAPKEGISRRRRNRNQRAPRGGVLIMQSLQIFICELQTAKRRLLKNLEVSDDSASAADCKQDAQDGDAPKPVKFFEKHRCMKIERLLRAECYRTRSVPTKTESVNRNMPRTRRHSFLSRLGRIRDWRSINNDEKMS